MAFSFSFLSRTSDQGSTAESSDLERPEKDSIGGEPTGTPRRNGSRSDESGGDEMERAEAQASLAGEDRGETRYPEGDIDVAGVYEEPAEETLEEDYQGEYEYQNKDDEYDEYLEYASPERQFLWFMAMPSWLISLLVHMMALFILALITLPDVSRTVTQLTVAAPDPAADQMDEFELDDIAEMPDLELAATELSTTDASLLETVEVDAPEVDEVRELESTPIALDLAEFAEQAVPRGVLTHSIGSISGSGVEGRGAAMRSEMVKRFGGTPGSESAVAAALKWLAAHQLPDGGWSFDHTIGPGNRTSSNPGTLREARNGATAMALLPFLGAGQTHMEGEYREVVARGLYFLQARQKSNGSFHESGGNMYSHGLAAITLCEAYAMTGDPALAPSAQASLNFISFAQDPVGGGWRYEPRVGGDTSVVGWQLMALKSGQLGQLQVPTGVITGAGRFLDAVQTDGGGQYGYTSPGRGLGTTSVGLLSRMYLGWKHDHPGLERGVRYLSEVGPSVSPSSTNMYYNYYATQVMRHYGGDTWDAWNEKLRDYLVNTQSKEGAAAGSWYLPGDHGSERGGRLYCTSMATMVLEVYYRHMPLYGTQAADEEFPL
jgi:hypothetical protein